MVKGLNLASREALLVIHYKAYMVVTHFRFISNLEYQIKN